MADKKPDECYHFHRPAPKCPMCGFVYPIQHREIEEVVGDLEQINAGELRAQLDLQEAKRRRKQQVGRAKTLEELQEIGRQRKYKPGWARFVFNSRSGRSGRSAT